MSNIVSEDLDAYAEQHSTDPHAVFFDLAKQTREEMEMHRMQVGKVEGGLLRMLARLVGARSILEIGTFTGYSALCMAEGMHEDGRLVTCDVDPKATTMAKEFWAKSPHGKKIELRLGPALDTIAGLDGPFDMAFIDADKQNYRAYWEAVVPKMRPGGLLVTDNVLWSGRVLQPRDELDIAVDTFNKHVVADERVEAVMLTVRDGVTLAWKR